MRAVLRLDEPSDAEFAEHSRQCPAAAAPSAPRRTPRYFAPLAAFPGTS
jgi:hypothetical protein